MEKGVLLKKKKYPEGALMTKSQFFLRVPLPEWSWIISFLSGNPFYRNGVSVVMVMVHVKESSANQVLHYKIVTAYLTCLYQVLVLVTFVGGDFVMLQSFCFTLS